MFEKLPDTVAPSPSDAFRQVLEKGGEIQVNRRAKSGSARLRAGLERALAASRAEGFDQGIEKGYEEGFERGYEDGCEKASEEHSDSIVAFRARLEQFVDEAHNSVEQWYASAEESLAKLGLEIARRAISMETESLRDSVLAIAKEALAEVRHGTTVRIKVNPIDAGLVSSHRDELLAAVADIRGLEIVPDLQVAHGCVVETDAGVVDARVETYLSRLAKEAA